MVRSGFVGHMRENSRFSMAEPKWIPTILVGLACMGGLGTGVAPSFSQGQIHQPLTNTDTDTDGDGIPNRSDADSDNDGITDIDEGLGQDPSLDTDVDNIPNWRDADHVGFVDSNADGVDDRFDRDRDGVPNHLDLDADNDGIPDLIENGGRVMDPNNDGQLETSPDLDQDGLLASVDNNDQDASDRTTQTPNKDTDQDGTIDALDRDADGDGLFDIFEGGGFDGNQDGVIDGFQDGENNGFDRRVDPREGGSSWPLPDTDSDGLLDFQDRDKDNDGVDDDTDSAPVDPLVCQDADADTCDDCSRTGVSGQKPDVDNDGLDEDEDGICDLGDDSDQDGILDPQDSDADNDTLENSAENSLGLDPQADNDQDGIPNFWDADDQGNGQASDCADPDQDNICDTFSALYDHDRDRIANHLDLDSDDDGVNDGVDNCYFAKNFTQKDSDNDGQGDACAKDTDEDGIPDSVDNCIDAKNADQADRNNDGVGDRCSDVDRDGHVDAEDNCPTVSNPDQSNLDGDPSGDACDDDANGDGVADDLTLAGGGCRDIHARGRPAPTWLLVGMALLLLGRPRHRCGVKT